MNVTTRADVVACARTWLGTPFQHQQRAKGVAVDCAGLVIGVARELGLVVRDFDVTGYSRHPDGHSLLRWCREYMAPVREPDLQPGDVIVVRYETRPQHMGIIGDYRHGGHSMIHAAEHAMLSKVVEHRLMLGPHMQFVAAFAMPWVED